MEGRPILALLYSTEIITNPDGEKVTVGHYDAITRLNAMFAKSYYCRICLNCYNSEEQHHCLPENKVCNCCYQPNCAGFLLCRAQRLQPKRPCQECFEYFYDEQCYENHLTLTTNRSKATEKTAPVCLTRRRCKKCFKKCEGFKQVRQHKCGWGFCDACEGYVELAKHKCFIQPPGKKRKRGDNRPKKRARLDSDACPEDFADEEAAGDDAEEEEKEPLNVYFDIESQQINGEHCANLVVWSSDEHLEGRFRHAFGENCLKEFIDDLQEFTEGDTREVRAIAHNLQGYDGYFVLKHYYNNNYLVEQIRNGAKLMTVKMDSVRFIDSLNFFQMPLSSFPATFNLEEKMKGFFPHLFNVPENMSYVGLVPPQHYYMPESMTLKTKEAFDKFYENAQAPVTRFDFKNELLLYCQSDVELLKLGCQKFQDIFEQYANFNPFNKITIASACNEDLRKNCMKKNTIACEPLYGWNGRQGNQSLIALEWLCWLNYEKRLQVIENMSVEEHEMHDDMAKYDVNYDDPRQRDQIQHERNGGEHADPRLRSSVDGLRRKHEHRLPIPWMLLARVPDML